jgi:predicted HTH transcriptional regulator
MAESQEIEYKESWRDEYFKTVCGFANAQGGICWWLTPERALHFLP